MLKFIAFLNGIVEFKSYITSHYEDYGLFLSYETVSYTHLTLPTNREV